MESVVALELAEIPSMQCFLFKATSYKKGSMAKKDVMYGIVVECIAFDDT